MGWFEGNVFTGAGDVFNFCLGDDKTSESHDPSSER